MLFLPDADIEPTAEQLVEQEKLKSAIETLTTPEGSVFNDEPFEFAAVYTLNDSLRLSASCYSHVVADDAKRALQQAAHHYDRVARKLREAANNL
jgi:hypothetical protein